jgi:hypothetical protein
MWHMFGRQRHGLAGFWISAHTRGAVVQGKTPKATYLDALAVGQGVGHVLQHRLDREFHIAVSQLGLPSRQYFYQFRLGHDVDFSYFIAATILPHDRGYTYPIFTKKPGFIPWLAGFR